jgi:hypothetical protein
MAAEALEADLRKQLSKQLSEYKKRYGTCLAMQRVLINDALEKIAELNMSPDRLPIGGRRVLVRKTRSGNFVAVLAAKA